MNILITGGAGFLGYNLGLYHVKRGDQVFILDNFFKTVGVLDKEFKEFERLLNVHMFQLDLTKPITELDVPKSLDIVYHLAAINGTSLFYEIPYQVARTNLLVTLNLLDWINGKSVGRLVYTSTSEVYAGGEKLGMLNIPTDESVPVVFPQPTSVRFSYATSKFMGEVLCVNFGKTNDVPVSVIRYHNIYGPRMGHKHVIPEFIDRIRKKNDPFKIYGGCETRAFCYIDDAVNATQLVATSGKCDGEIIHIGNMEEEITIEVLARLMMEIMGEKLTIKECGRRKDSVARRCPDTSNLKKLTGYEPKWYLKDGILKTVEWYVSHSTL